MDKVSRVLYLLAGLVNAIIELFAVLTILCVLDGTLNWGGVFIKLSFFVFADSALEIGTATLPLAVVTLLFSVVLYFLGVKGRKNLKNHTHRLPSHIFTLIIAMYYFFGAVGYLSVLNVTFLAYSMIGGAILYFAAGLTGIIGHNR